MSDLLRDKRRERVRMGMSTHGFHKAHQKRQAKRALSTELKSEQVAAPGPEPEDIAPDPAPENASWDPNWDSEAERWPCDCCGGESQAQCSCAWGGSWSKPE